MQCPIHGGSHYSYCLILTSSTSFFYYLHCSEGTQSVTPLISFILWFHLGCMQVEYKFLESI